MVAFNFANFFKATVTSTYGTSETSIGVSTVSGAPETPFRATWYNKTDYPDPSDDPNAEVVEVTAAASSPITVVRGAEGTAKTHNTAGKTYELIHAVSHESLYSFTQTYNVMAFGAVGDGVADDGAAIQSAIDRCNTDGGGVVYFPPGTYKLDSYQYSAQHSHLRIRSNVAIIGSGQNATTIKVANGVMPQNDGPPYWYGIFFETDGTSVNNVLFRDFKIDFNGDNNTVASTFDENHPAYGIGIQQGNNIIVENVHFFDHPGRQILNFGNNTTPGDVTDVRISKCLFEDVATGAAAGTNQYQTDHSSIYLAANRCCVESNIMKHRVPTTWLGSTAIETHGTDIICRGNYISDYDRGFNLSGESAPGHRQIITCNIINDCRSAMFVWTDASNGANDILFDRNICIQKDLSSFAKQYDALVSFEHVNTLNPVDNVVISGNQFISNWQEPAEATYGHGIYIVYCKHLEIKDNLFKDLNGRGIHQGNLNADELYLTMTGNTLLDCGQTNSSSYDAGIELLLATTAVKRVVIENNTIENTSTVYMARGIRINLNVDTMRVRNNTIRNVTTPVDIAGESENSFTDTMVKGMIVSETLTTGTTPSVGNGADWYYLSYGGSTTITDFSESYDGQEITLLAANGNCTIQHGAGVIELEGAINFPMSATGDMLRLKMRSGVWYEISRRNA